MKAHKLIIKCIIVAALLAAHTSCKRNPLKVDISGIKTEVEVIRFEEELFAIPLQDTLAELSAIRTKYPELFDLFTWKVINAGGIEEDYFSEIMSQFITDTMVLNAKHASVEVFQDFNEIEKDLIKAFKYYQYHFPNKQLPVIYTMISGFNQSVVTAENLIGISLDKYLGRDFSLYQNLNNIPLYKINNMHPEKIVPDIAYAWGMTEFDESRHATSLLDHIIMQGKLMYFTDAMLPEVHDSLKIGYTSRQLQWSIDNEPQMWNHLVENKLLFSNKRMDILRYINDGPYTTGFPVESPPRSGIWIGWQIIREYMNNNKELSLSDLMGNRNYAQILNDSKYFPQ